MRLIVLVFSILSSFSLAAQTFSASPAPVLEKEIQFDQANECKIYFHNPSGDSLHLHWRQITNNLPANWTADLCDYGTCYNGIPGNALMNVVYDTIEAYLKLIVRPEQNDGACWIGFRVYEEGNPGNFVDVFFSLHTPGTVAATEPQHSPIEAFPNPVAETLSLRQLSPDAGPVFIFNALGKPFWHSDSPSEQPAEIDVKNWPAGWYTLRCGGQSKMILVTR